MYSLLIKNALVVDGTGKAPIVADVAVNNDRIVNIAPDISTGAKEVVHS